MVRMLGAGAPDNKGDLHVSCSVVSQWTVACQAPLSMEFSRQEYWSGFPFLSLRDLPNPGIKPRSPASQADSLPLEPQRKPRSTD